jgi:hypothetical protein
MKALVIFGALALTSQVAFGEVKLLKSANRLGTSAKTATIVSMDIPTGQIIVNQGNRTGAGFAQHDNYGRIKLRPNEKIIGSQTHDASRGGPLIVVVTHDLVTGDIFLYHVDRSAFYSSEAVPPRFVRRVNIPATDKIIDIEISQAAFSQDSIAITAIDTVTNRVVVYDVSRVQDQRRDFGALRLEPSEKIVGASFDRGMGRASSDRSSIVAIDSKTGLVAVNIASGMGHPIVDREVYGKVELQPSEKVVGADYLVRAFADQVSLIVLNSETGEIATNLADGRGSRSFVREARMGRANLMRSCESAFVNSN